MNSTPSHHAEDPGNALAAGNSLGDDAILGVLMQGRRILPSKQVAANQDLPPPFAKEWESRGSKLASTLGSVKQTLTGLRAKPLAQQLDALINFTGEIATAFDRFIQSSNELPGPGATRHRSIGEVILPMALAHWNAYPPSENAALIYDLHVRHHPRPESGEFPHGGPPWLTQALSFFNIAENSEGLPGAEAILERSRSLAPALRTLKAEIAALEKKISNIEKNLRENSDDKAVAKMNIELAEARQQYTAKEQRINPLLERLIYSRLAKILRGSQKR